MPRRAAPEERAVPRCAAGYRGLRGLAGLAAVAGLLAMPASAAAEVFAGAGMHVLEDRDGTLGPADVAGPAGASRLRPLFGNRLEAGYSRSVFWVRVRLPQAQPPRQRMLIEVGSPVIDRVEAFRREAGAWRSMGVAGDGVAWSRRPYPHRKPVFAVDLDPARDDEPLLLRIAGEGTLNATIRMWPDEASFVAASAEDDLFYGLYFGFLAAMLAYNLFLWAGVRDRAYLWYVAYVAALALLQGKLSGYADRFLWPQAPGLANPANLLALAAVLAGGAQFTKAFLGAAAQRWRRRISAAQIAVGAALALYPLSYSIATRALLLVALALIAVLVAAMVRAYRGGYRPARFILVAFAALAPGGVAVILRALGVLGPDFPAEPIFHAATALEALLLSFGLADRINAMAAERRRAEAALGRLERRYAGALLEAQESERKRMAAELHDAIGQNLVVVGNRLRSLPAEAGPRAAAVADLVGVNRETLDQVRGLARSLHPPEIERLGLGRALEMMAARAVEGSGIALAATIAPDLPALPSERAIQVYRLAQEGVTNAVKHSGAKRLWVSLTRGGPGFTLAVADDGIGFDPAAAGPSMGLATIRQRAALLGGELTFARRPEGGTEMRVTIPESLA